MSRLAGWRQVAKVARSSSTGLSRRSPRKPSETPPSASCGAACAAPAWHLASHRAKTGYAKCLPESSTRLRSPRLCRPSRQQRRTDSPGNKPREPKAAADRQGRCREQTAGTKTQTARPRNRAPAAEPIAPGGERWPARIRLDMQKNTRTACVRRDEAETPVIIPFADLALAAHGLAVNPRCKYPPARASLPSRAPAALRGSSRTAPRLQDLREYRPAAPFGAASPRYPKHW